MTDKPDYMWQGDARNEGHPRMFETSSERVRRRISIIIINIVGFINMLGFSIVLTGAYPYLLQIDEEADKVLLGWIIAANPLGQLISSPLVGWLSNRWKTVRWLCMASGFFNLIGFVIYACLEALPQPRRYWMMGARFVVGLAAGSITLCITYISKATTTKERTTAISINALAQTLGFIVGPVLQSTLIPFGPDGFPLTGSLRFNMYTSAGWLSASLSLVYMSLFLPCIFTEYNMAERETFCALKMTDLDNSNGEEENNYSIITKKITTASNPRISKESNKTDLLGATICTLNFSVAAFILIMIESLATPMAMDLLGYTEEEAVQKVGILLSTACVLTAFAFALSGPLAKRFTERKVLLFLGLVPLFIGQIVMLPYGGPTPLMQNESNYDSFQPNVTDEKVDFNGSNLALTSLRNSSSRPIGCPVAQEWCLYTSAVREEQLIAGFIISAIAYAFTAAMSTSTLTHVLDSQQQGMWTGIYLAGGSLSRILSPIYLNNMYASYGTWATSGSILVLLLITIAFNSFNFPHLIPLIRRHENIL